MNGQNKIIMKIKIMLALLVLVSTVSFGQKKSPKTTAEGTAAKTTIKIDYCSPRVRDRVIYGNLVPYNKVWRAGANENTTVEFNKDVKINGESLSAGKYGFFIIPAEDDKWTIIFSTKNDAWGSSSYKTEEDALRLTVNASSSKESTENLTFSINSKGIYFAWADKEFMLKIK